MNRNAAISGRYTTHTVAKRTPEGQPYNTHYVYLRVGEVLTDLAVIGHVTEEITGNTARYYVDGDPARLEVITTPARTIHEHQQAIIAHYENGSIA